MLKKYALILLLLLSIGGTAFAYNNTYALIVGVADYRDGNKDLVYTVPDAVSFSRFLQSKKGGSVPASNIILLTDSQATKANIIAQGKALFSKAKKDDRVIFYFAGHGDKGCFVPYDNGDNVLGFDDVKAIFRCAKSNTKLLFGDSCFSGSLREELNRNEEIKRTMERGTKAADDMKNIVVMMACRGNETAHEHERWGHGLFTYYLMKGLSGEANSNGNQYVTIAELYVYVLHEVQYTSFFQQTPDLFGNFNMQLIVADL